MTEDDTFAALKKASYQEALEWANRNATNMSWGEFKKGLMEIGWDPHVLYAIRAGEIRDKGPFK
jgi:hypothetical protein